MVDPQVLWAIANGGADGRIAVAYVEWAAAGAQDVVVDWMVVDGRGVGAGLRRAAHGGAAARLRLERDRGGAARRGSA